MDPVRHTAVHEAGHAVIARVLGLPAGEATIIANLDEDTAGYHKLGSQWQAIDLWWAQGLLHKGVRSAVRGRILVLMAGAEAEEEILGNCQGGDTDDRYWISIVADDGDAYFTPELWERYEPRMRRQTRRLVRHHRNEIEQVAAALLKHKTLEASEIDHIVCAKKLSQPK